MRTQNEIRNMSLLEQQKLLVDLRTVDKADKFYPRAQEIIAFTTGLKKYEEPEPIEVVNVAEHDINVDGRLVQKGATTKVFVWQQAALARFLEKVEAS